MDIHDAITRKKSLKAWNDHAFRLFFVRYRIYKLSAELMEFYIVRKTSAKSGLSSVKYDDVFHTAV
ncbi:hypothetical protein XI25_22410 [Paenibacillus sp. DMB20]|nr:hypothetical protein XI25_22410 [Paenibacillus sp. DMB20]